MMHPPERALHWKHAWRIIPTLYPEEPLYAPIAARGDWAAIIELERWTNSGVQQELGDRRFLRDGDQIPKGKSAYNIGRPFAFPTSSRFSDGSFGVFYAAKDLITAVAERMHHTALFMRRTAEAANTLRQRVLTAQIHGVLHDLRKPLKKWRAYYRPSDYSAAQKLGAHLWAQNSAGIAYNSVRHEGGECVGVFKPQAISHCRQERCLQFEWDGQKVAHVYEIKEFLK